MFYCEPCREKNNWPGIRPSSRGKCELCGDATACYDAPSSFLPKPPKRCLICSSEIPSPEIAINVAASFGMIAGHLCSPECGITAMKKVQKAKKDSCLM